MRKCRYCKCEIPKRVNRPQTAEQRVQNAGFCCIAHLIEHENEKKAKRAAKAEAKRHKEKLQTVRAGTKKDNAANNAREAVNRSASTLRRDQ